MKNEANEFIVGNKNDVDLQNDFESSGLLILNYWLRPGSFAIRHQFEI